MARPTKNHYFHNLVALVTNKIESKKFGWNKRRHTRTPMCIDRLPHNHLLRHFWSRWVCDDLVNLHSRKVKLNYYVRRPID